MSIVERLGFDMPVAACILGHYRLLSGMVRRRLGISYNAFTALFVLHSVRGPVQLGELASYLILAHKTLFAFLTELEDRGYVVKSSLTQDRRRMWIALTDDGRETVEEALSHIDAAFEGVFCRNLPSGEFSGFMDAEVMRGSLDAIRGEAVRLPTITNGQRYYSAEHFIYWRALAQNWARIVREESGLPFNAFGILALLREKGPLDTTCVVDALKLARSEVSARKRQLLELGALEETPVFGDARKTRLSLTDAGSSLAGRLHGLLEDYMASVDTTHDDETAAVINAWYYRMYTNIRSYSGNLDEY